MKKNARFNTKLIHAGVEPDPTTGAIMTPIYQTSTYVQEAPGVHKGYEYARTQNPTRNVLQQNIAALEGARFGIAYSSGLAALDTILKTLSPGDELLSTNDLYGGSYRLMRKQYEKYGIKFKFVDMTNLDELKSQLTESIKLIWIESPTNPMLRIIDIAAICNLVKNHPAKVCVDNTFASPYLQNPLNLGADLAYHSATKYLGGHSDVVMGLVATSDEQLAEQLYFLQNAAGAVPGPQDCFLMLRGIKTLHVRVQRACDNARQMALALQNHPKINNLYYPGLLDHPGHDIARAQMRDFGAMLSFDLKENTMAAANEVLSKTQYFSLAESLGGVESLIGHPASMTHASIPKAERLKVGLSDSLIRLSIGIEDEADLIEDILGALE